MRRPGVIASSVAVVALAACGSDQSTAPAASGPTVPSSVVAYVTASTAVVDPGDGGDYRVTVDPSAFSSVVDNPFMPLRPGSRWVYREVDSDGEAEQITVEVLDQHRRVMGVDTIVVHDVARSDDGDVIEDTYDWFAQDSSGNVWYFGEDTTTYEDGAPRTTGSWEAGVGGALPGIVMLAVPAVSDHGYRQEFLAGEAEDMAEVIAVTGSVSVPAGDFDDVIVTEDWTPLEPDVVEHKTYGRGVGLVHESKMSGDSEVGTGELIEFSPGP